MLDGSPDAPPLLSAMGARKEKLEKARIKLFKEWKASLEIADGNITRAAAYMDPPISRNRGSKLTYKFGLEKWAKFLRMDAMGRSMGPGARIPVRRVRAEDTGG